MRDVDRLVAALAERQRGLITKEQALELGLQPAQVAWRTRSGAWLIERRNVYRFAGVPVSWEQAVLATTLSLGAGVVASHETALRLHTGRRERGDEVLEVSSPRHRRVVIPGVRAHRSVVLFDADLVVRHGIRVTSPARTVVDLSSRRTAKELGRVVDELLRRRLLRLPSLAQCVARLGPAPGRSPRKVHEVLQARWEGYDPGDSDLESRVLAALHVAGLPLPRQQYRVVIEGRRRYIDLAYPDLKLAIEIDSWAYHRFRSSFDGDRARDNELVVLGWYVLRITDRMTDAEIVAVVRRALEALGGFAVA
jgi:very-short-patch-repair endonuclease